MPHDCIIPALNCEGNAEEAILNILLNNHLLVYERENILEEKVLRERSGKNFCSKYLQLDFGNAKVILYYVHDSKRENFNPPKQFKNKIECKHIITAPEIEILEIIGRGLYQKYTQRCHHNLKPSDFLKQYNKTGKIKHSLKSKEHIEEFFHDPAFLVWCIYQYSSLRHISSDEECLFDLLNEEAKDLGRNYSP